MVPDWDTLTDLKSIDLDTLKGLHDLDPEPDSTLVKDILSAYVESTEQLVVRLNSAVNEANVKEVFQTAHNLKSSSRGVGALQLAELCADLEGKTKQSTVVDKLVADEISKEIAKVLVEIRSLILKSF